jgi:hypothetical protein
MSTKEKKHVVLASEPAPVSFYRILQCHDEKSSVCYVVIIIIFLMSRFCVVRVCYYVLQSLDAYGD